MATARRTNRCLAVHIIHGVWVCWAGADFKNIETCLDFWQEGVIGGIDRKCISGDRMFIYSSACHPIGAHKNRRSIPQQRHSFL